MYTYDGYVYIYIYKVNSMSVTSCFLKSIERVQSALYGVCVCMANSGGSLKPGGDTSGYYTKPRQTIQSPKTLYKDIEY